MDNLTGLDNLLPFLNFLKDNKIWFVLQHLRDDAIMVTITLMGARVEIEFFEDHIEYSRFVGDESVERDVKALLDLIGQDIE